MRLFIPSMGVLAVTILTVGIGTDRVHAAKPGKNIPVTVAFADEASDNIRSDGLGVYQDGVRGVVAYINASFNGSLTFATNTADTGGRQLNFNFGSCLLELPNFCSYPFLSGYAVAQIQGAPRDANALPTTNGLMGMPVGATMTMFVQLRLLGQPDEWTLCMKPQEDGFCNPSESATYARIARVRSDAWEVFATADADALGSKSDSADLLKTTGVGKRKTITIEGTYSMPFRFTVSCVNAANCS